MNTTPSTQKPSYKTFETLGSKQIIFPLGLIIKNKIGSQEVLFKPTVSELNADQLKIVLEHTENFDRLWHELGASKESTFQIPDKRKLEEE